MTCRHTARLRLRKARSCCESSRPDAKTNAGLLGRRASLGTGGCRRRHRGIEPCTVSPRGAVEVPGLGRPVNVALNLEVGEAGAPSPSEISRAIVAAHACAGAARFPHSHSAVAEREELTETGLGVDRKMLWSLAASSSQQRARVLTDVKARRFAPPPLRGADGLDAGSAHARPDWLLSTMLTHTPSTCCGRRPVQNDALSGDR